MPKTDRSGLGSVAGLLKVARREPKPAKQGNRPLGAFMLKRRETELSLEGLSPSRLRFNYSTVAACTIAQAADRKAPARFGVLR